MSYATLYLKPKTGVENKKAQYDRTLKKHKEVVAFIDDAALPFPVRLERKGEFVRLTNELNGFIASIQADGYRMTSNEILNGFGTNTERTSIY